MTRGQAIKWWQEAKFGLFIHWGIYSMLGRGEWVMYSERIPVKEYEKLAAGFNPVKFNAEEWVKLAKDAGMKYIVITAKHHDGFSMFRTAVSKFNIVDATPFGRDVIAELAEACRKEDIKLGFYYSHVREWRHPKAQSFEAQGRPDRLGNYGNFWDYPNENVKDLNEYIDEFDIPQLKELLTQYGDVLTIWFDTPSLIQPAQAERLKKTVRKIQPACLVNSRLSEDIEVDYRSMGDNEVPSEGGNTPWETAMTTMSAWGYRKDAKFGRWEDMLRKLVDVASKGGNLLLNVGPDAEGVIPAEAQRELKKLGAWLQKNGQAIYRAGKSPFASAPEWGRVTCRGKKMYLIVTDPAAGTLALTGLRTEVVKCRLLGGKALPMEQGHDAARDKHRLTVKLAGVAERFPVVVLELAGEIDVVERLEPEGDGRIVMPVSRAEVLNESGERGLRISEGGVTEGWTDARDRLRWTFFAEKTGWYQAELTLKTGFWGLWDWGHEVNAEIDEQVFGVSIAGDGGKGGYGEVTVPLAEVWLTEGRHVLTLAPEKLEKEQMQGLTAANCIVRPR